MGDIGTAGPAVLVRSVYLTYPGGIEALHDLNATVNAGEFVSIVGPSGCGKSTFLKAVAGLVPITSGELSVPAHGSGKPAAVSFVFQSPTLLSWRTVLGNLLLPVELQGGDRGEGLRQADDLLHLVGLQAFHHRFPTELSGGMQMRVSLARALMTKPSVLLLDEPFGALDDLTRQKLNEDLHRLWLSDRWTALFVTHNVAEAVFLSHRVLVMSARPGRFVADISVDLPMPRDPWIRGETEFASYVRQIGEVLRSEQ